jgi:hypothetical protein
MKNKNMPIRSNTAERALEEAKLRNNKRNIDDLPLELGGRDGPEPTRFGDWEKKGITSDF